MRIVLEIEVMARIWRNVAIVDNSVPLRRRLIRDGGFLHMVISVRCVIFILCSLWNRLIYIHSQSPSRSPSAWPSSEHLPR
jgi:hypothetical protein